MTGTMRVRRDLMMGVSAFGSLIAGYGRAFAQSCTVQPDNSVLCAGAATTTQTIALDGTKTSITTAPGFSINTATGDALAITEPSAGPAASLSPSFTDNNRSSISGQNNGILFSAPGNFPTRLTITSDGAIVGKTGDGINARLTGSNRDLGISINAADVRGGQSGINAYGAGSGDISITTSGQVAGTGASGIYAGLYRNATGNVAIKAADASGHSYGIAAINQGTGSTTITATGTIHSDGAGGGLNNRGGGTSIVDLRPAAIAGVNFSTATDLTITSSGPITSSGNGILAVNYGSGPTSVTVSGSITTPNGVNGIGAFTQRGLDVHLTSTGSLTGGTLFAVGRGGGDDRHGRRADHVRRKQQRQPDTGLCYPIRHQ